MDHALSQSLHEHTAGMRRYALSLTRDPARADDHVQEALKRVLTYLRSGREIVNMRAYLFTVLTRVHFDEVVRERRKGIHVPIHAIEDAAISPPDQIDRLECRDLWRALDRLPPEQREVLLLVGFNGVSYRHAAEALRVPIGTVMSRLSRGRSSLRAMLSGNEPADQGRMPDRVAA